MLISVKNYMAPNVDDKLQNILKSVARKDI